MARIEPKKASRTQRFRLLADENKLRIIEVLFNGPVNVTDLGKRLKIGQPLVSHHLQGLKRGGIATCFREGKEIFYCLAEGIKAGKGKKILELGCCRVHLR